MTVRRALLHMLKMSGLGRRFGNPGKLSRAGNRAKMRYPEQTYAKSGPDQ